MENQDNIKNMQSKFIEYANNSMEMISANDTPRVKQLRQEALKRFSDNGFPTKKMEKWRNSRVIECVNENFNIDKIESKKHDFCCVIRELDTEVISMTNGQFSKDESLIRFK